MQHKNKTKEFGRTRNQRRAMFKTMLGSLIMQEKIVTTEAKAKEIKGRIDRILNKAKKTKDKSKKIGAIRDLFRFIPEVAIKKITGDFLDNFEDRKSGYTRIVKLSPRKSDGARMASIEFVKSNK
jgi:large subunit ribosomal protein L17